MDEQVRVGLVGIAGYGGSYVKALLHDPRAAGAQVVAAADPNAANSEHLQVLQERGVPVCSSADEMFAGTKLDLAIISSPIHFHAPQTRAALRSGAHVLCEKPLAGSVSDAMQMLRDSQLHRRMVAVGFQWSFTSAIQALKRDIRSGVLGKPLRLRTYVVFPRGFKYYARNSWAGRVRSASGAPVLDSPVNNATAHFLHNMFYLLGDGPSTSLTPASVQAELYRANDIENYDTAFVRCTMPGGAEVLFYTTHSMPVRYGPRCVFEFENAVVSDDGELHGGLTAKLRDGTTRRYGNPNHEATEKIWQTLAAVKSGDGVLCDVASALPHTLATIAAQKSAEIVPFPANLKRQIECDDGPMIVVDGLDAVMQQVSEKGVLPSELASVSWAKPGRIISIAEVQQQE